MCLRFAFLLTARVFSWLRLSQREDTWKTAEILILRHQLAVLQRRQPRRSSLNWADRALLATLPSVIPKALSSRVNTDPQALLEPKQRKGVRIGPALTSAPPRDAAAGHTRHDPALAPRHLPPPLGGAVQARQDRPPCHPPEHQGPGSPAGPGKPRMGLPADPRRAGRPGSEGSGFHAVGNSEERRDRPRAAADPGLPGRSSCVLGPRRSWRVTSSPPACPAAPRPRSWPW